MAKIDQILAFLSIFPIIRLLKTPVRELVSTEAVPRGRVRHLSPREDDRRPPAEDLSGEKMVTVRVIASAWGRTSFLTAANACGGLA
jgi:hypothetical protein